MKIYEQKIIDANEKDYYLQKRRAEGHYVSM